MFDLQVHLHVPCFSVPQALHLSAKHQYYAVREQCAALCHDQVMKVMHGLVYEPLTHECQTVTTQNSAWTPQSQAYYAVREPNVE